jgi:aspartyl-tRNA synthetase
MSETEPKVDAVENPEAAAPAPAPKQKKVKAPKVPKQQAPAIPCRDQWKIENREASCFGDLPIINSASKSDRVYTDIKDVDASLEGKPVIMRGHVHTVRGSGKNTFIVIRASMYTLQLVMSAYGNPGEPPIELVKYAAKIPNESYVEIHGVVAKPNQEVASCSQKDAEIHVKQIYVVSLSAPLPFQMADANRIDPLDKGEDNERVADADAVVATDSTGNVRVLQDKRLDNRPIDIRTIAGQGIFRLQAEIEAGFRDFFRKRGFTGIHTPKIIPGVSEGGSNVFNIDYFGRQCCLAQSPQLYKQMAVTAFHRVFEIGPVFRAENSNTHRHMCEFIGLDFEMEIKDHYHEVLKMLAELFVSMFDHVNAHCAAELAAVNAQYPFSPLKYNKEVVTITFKEARQMLLDAGETLGEFSDPSTPQEKLLGRLMKEKYDVDLYIVDKYPAAIRPFYTMPCPEDPNYSNSYDVFLRGEEITSGAQRIHDPILLAKRAHECGIPPEGIADYVKTFQYGAFPHGGAGIGLERVVMLFLGLNNIRKASMFPRVPNRVTP